MHRPRVRRLRAPLPTAIPSGPRALSAASSEWRIVVCGKSGPTPFTVDLAEALALPVLAKHTRARMTP